MLLLELALEKESDHHLNNYRPGGGGSGGKGYQGSRPWQGPFSAFVLPEGRLNSVLVDYLSQNNLGELLRLGETLASKTKARD